MGALKAVPAAALALLLGACSSGTSGLKPRVPTTASGRVDSVRPELEWESLDRPTWSGEAVTAVTYELRVWHDGDIIYERSGLEAPRHRIEEPLREGERYAWTVRAWFQLGGRRRCTQWGRLAVSDQAPPEPVFWGDGTQAYPLTPAPREGVDPR